MCFVEVKPFDLYLKSDDDYKLVTLKDLQVEAEKRGFFKSEFSTVRVTITSYGGILVIGNSELASFYLPHNKYFIKFGED